VVTEALCAEAHACVAGLQAASDWGLQHIILETDSQVLVKALKTEDYDRAPGEVLFREAKFLMSTVFASSSVIYASRLCNSVAHELACLGRDRDPDHPLFGLIPSLFL
jgi:ribonuclease HI